MNKNDRCQHLVLFAFNQGFLNRHKFKFKKTAQNYETSQYVNICKYLRFLLFFLNLKVQFDEEFFFL